MQFVLYTEKTVAQCMTAINERLHAKAKGGYDGWVEKSGSFSISVETPVIAGFTRRTTLRAKAERESGTTVIKGGVSSGANRQERLMIFIGLGVIAALLAVSYNVAFGVLALAPAPILYIALRGDSENSQMLMREVQRTLGARTTPPKKADTAKSGAGSRGKAPARSTSGSLRAPAPSLKSPSSPTLFEDAEEEDSAP